MFIEGTVRNTGSRPSRDVTVTVEGLDADGMRVVSADTLPTPQAIPPGTTASYVVRLPNDPARLKSFEVRFSGVVYPGETITTDMWQISPGKIVLTAKTERGEAVLTGAAAEVAT